MAVHQLQDGAAIVATLTRPNDTNAYTAGDAVSNSTTAGSVTPLSWSIRGTRKNGFVARVGIEKSSTTATAAAFRLHLFTSQPVAGAGDNATLTVSSDLEGYIGYVDVDMSTNGLAGASAGLKAFGAATLYFELDQSDDTDFTLYGLLAATAGYTPAAQEVFDISLVVVDDDES